MTKKYFTLLLLTHNSAKDLNENFQWLNTNKSINEIVVVDDNSTDTTIETIKKLSGNKKITIKSRQLDNFSSQRNFAISLAKGNNIFWLDPDEKINKHSLELLSKLNIDHNIVFCIRRRELFLGKVLKYTEAGKMYIPRIFDKNNGKFNGDVHETWVSSATYKNTDIEILHNSNKTVNIFYQKINKYSSLRATELYNQKKKAGYFSIIFYPLAKFIQNYILKLGFLDGIEGAIFCFGMSFHSFLVRSKLWHLQKSS